MLHSKGQKPYIHCSEQWGPAWGADVSSDPAWHEESQTHVRHTGSSLPRREGTGEAAWGSTRLPTPDVWGQERLVAPLTGGIFKGSFGEARPLPEGFSASLQAGEESPRPQMNDSFKRIQHTLNCTVKCCISIECSRSPGRPAEKVQEKLTANIRTKKCYHVNKNIRLRIKRKRMGTGTPSCSKVCGAEAQALSPSWDTSR